MKLPRTEEQIYEQLNAAEEQAMQGGSKWPGMSYEDGVRNTIRWMIGDDDSPPMEDEE